MTVQIKTTDSFVKVKISRFIKSKTLYFIFRDSFFFLQFVKQRIRMLGFCVLFKVRTTMMDQNHHFLTPETFIAWVCDIHKIHLKLKCVCLLT